MPLFQRTELQTAAPYTVPSSDALRQQALARGWQRSRQVAQRRLAWRWLGWAITRFGVPVLLVLALGVSLAELVDSAMFYFLPPSANLAAAPAAAKPTVGPSLPLPESTKAPAIAGAATAPAAAAAPASDPITAALRLSRQLEAERAFAAASAPALKADPVANPTLQLTPLLTRKEPL